MDENNYVTNQSHAWRGVWDRPMKIDENSYDPLTIARMTNHNVRGRAQDKVETAEFSPEDSAEVSVLTLEMTEFVGLGER